MKKSFLTSADVEVRLSKIIDDAQVDDGWLADRSCWILVS